jgi:anti-sigma regulatory factor (Ser/Thr protein kinase)
MARASGFHHEAVFYESDAEYVAAAVPEMRATLAHGGAVLAAVADAKRELLSDALGADAEQVRFADMATLGRNPACIIPAWRGFLRHADPDEPVLGIGEPVWPGRSDDELVECSRHESLLNLAFDDGREWRLLCPYDTRALGPPVLDEARRNHPHVRRHGRSAACDDYRGRQAILAWEHELPAPPRRAAELAFAADDLAPVRSFVAERARDAGMDGERRRNLVLAANELVTNSLRHARGSGMLRTWQHDGTFVCEVRDRGRIADPLAGRARPGDGEGSGRGLWIVNHLCDLVQVRSTEAGSVVRLHMALN